MTTEDMVVQAFDALSMAGIDSWESLAKAVPTAVVGAWAAWKTGKVVCRGTATSLGWLKRLVWAKKPLSPLAESLLRALADPEARWDDRGGYLMVNGHRFSFDGYDRIRGVGAPDRQCWDLLSRRERKVIHRAADQVVAICKKRQEQNDRLAALEASRNARIDATVKRLEEREARRKAECAKPAAAEEEMVELSLDPVPPVPVAQTVVGPLKMPPMIATLTTGEEVPVVWNSLRQAWVDERTNEPVRGPVATWRRRPQ